METKKKRVIITTIIIVLVALAALGAYKYISYRNYCNSHFQGNTTINGIDCSNLTKDEAIDKLTDEWNGHEFTITKNGSEMLTLKNLDFSYDIEKKVKALMDEMAKFPVYNKLFNKNSDLKLAMIPKDNNNNFEKQISTLDIFDNPNAIKTKNAYLDLSNTNFTIVKEIYGTNISRTDFENKIHQLIGQGKWTLSYNEKDFYEQPTIKSDNKKLLKRQTYAKKYLSHVITYTFGSNSRVITPSELDEMITVNSSGKIKVRKSVIRQFVSSLASKYNTLGESIKFNSRNKGTVTIPSGTYGYAINQSQEVEKLIKDIKSAKNVTREPVYAQKGWGWENNGVGTTYVEISISSQHLWYYQNGKLRVSTDIVSGDIKSSETTTPTGAYYLVYKSANATLKGENADGSKYETPVDCWMPFDGGFGMHDANWRGSFGGKIYRGNGSHGCVNMPPSQAHKLFNLISQGCPVLVYY